MEILKRKKLMLGILLCATAMTTDAMLAGKRKKGRKPKGVTVVTTPLPLGRTGAAAGQMEDEQVVAARLAAVAGVTFVGDERGRREAQRTMLATGLADHVTVVTDDGGEAGRRRDDEEGGDEAWPSLSGGEKEKEEGSGDERDADWVRAHDERVPDATGTHTAEADDDGEEGSASGEEEDRPAQRTAQLTPGELVTEKRYAGGGLGYLFGSSGATLCAANPADLVLKLLRNYDPDAHVFGNGKQPETARLLTAAAAHLRTTRDRVGIKEMLRLCLEKDLQLDETGRRTLREAIAAEMQKDKTGLMTRLAELEAEAQQLTIAAFGETHALRSAQHLTHELGGRRTPEPDDAANYGTPGALLGHLDRGPLQLIDGDGAE